MKAFTVREPWATLFALEKKPDETRSRPTSYRGPVAIHTSARTPVKQFNEAMERAAVLAAFRDYSTRDTFIFHLKNGAAPGCFVAVAELYDCLPVEQVEDDGLGDYSPGRFVWRTRSLRRVAPFPAKGFLGLWNVKPEDVVRLVEAEKQAAKELAAREPREARS
jgi:hypothetical protein